MKPVLPLFIMIDACGWEILRGRSFGSDFAPHRRKLRSVFGYSSACVPSIVSGRWPEDHRNWCYFVYDPEHSPFKNLRALRWVPRAISSRRIFRRFLTKWVRWRMGFRGYFDLYNVPFEHIGLFDFTERKSPLKPGGMNRGNNIFDYLGDRRIPCYAGDPERTEEENRDGLIERIRSETIDFAWLYWPGLDGLLHRVGNDSEEIGRRLGTYEEWIRNVVRESRDHYRDVRLFVFSDHGMANCDELLDLQAQIEPLGLEFGRDYAAVYDSTMARFWFFNEPARRKVTERLNTVSQGRILSDAELAGLKVFFEDRYFGELIFLVREGVLIVPSHMGERPIRAMHGYHPEEKHSHAALLTGHSEVPEDVRALPDLHRLMTAEADRAHALNRPPRAGRAADVRPIPVVERL